MASVRGGRQHAPIFLHSLFRSGSTYFFQCFRRSGENYWTYQEPLHEYTVAFGKSESGHRRLRSIRRLTEFALQKRLRHPSLGSKGYFHELEQTWPEWKGRLVEDSVYHHYFASDDQGVAKDYFHALIRASRGTPVIQECRTTNRIEPMKKEFGGSHVFLWRNPWDQWWSYLMEPYFESANQLIAWSENPPDILRDLREDMPVQPLSYGKLQDRLFQIIQLPTESHLSYRLFYSIWCLALDHALDSADVTVSIDGLSDSTDYRSRVIKKLDKVGAKGLDFWDCDVPQSLYSEEEIAFFTEIENGVHRELLASGWSEKRLERLVAEKNAFEPQVRAGGAVASDDHTHAESSRTRLEFLQTRDRVLAKVKSRDPIVSFYGIEGGSRRLIPRILQVIQQRVYRGRLKRITTKLWDLRVKASR